MSTKYVCSECGSDMVYCDAWVGLNDPDDIKVFDNTYCDECEGQCSIDEAQEDGPYCACDAAQQPCNSAWHKDGDDA